MQEQYIKLSDLRKVKGIGEKTIERIKNTLLKSKSDIYKSKYNSELHLDINKIHYGDCLDLMNGIKDKSVDMILCDLPYGITACSWDEIIPLDKLWEQYERIIKDNGVIALTASQPFTSRLINSNLTIFKYTWVWEKDKPTNFGNANRQPLRYHEDICIFYKNQPTYNKQMIPRKSPRIKQAQNSNYNFRNSTKSDVTFATIGSINANKYDANWKNPSTIIKIPSLRANSKEWAGHPTQKPVALFEYLIKTYTNKSDLVLDNCIGSGTTAIACLNTGRKFIGIEKEKKYFDIANKRIKEWHKNNK